MNIHERIEEHVEFLERMLKRYGSDLQTMSALTEDLPEWLEDHEITQLINIWGETAFAITIKGDMDTVRAIQHATGTLLTRNVAESTGEITFCGKVKSAQWTFDVLVTGDLRLAPGCELIPVEETVTVTRFKVSCPDGSAAEPATAEVQ